MERITIIVENRNGREFLPLCLSSIRRHLARPDHAVLILDDASTDGSREWLRDHQEQFGYAVEFQEDARCGPAAGLQHLVQAASTALIWLIDSAMYFAPAADAETARHLRRGVVCTCTRITAHLSPSGSVVADCGAGAVDFREQDFLMAASHASKPGTTSNGIRAPLMCHRDDYLALDGHDPLFVRAGMDDPDLLYRMAAAGYGFAQSWSAFCYRFERYAHGQVAYQDADERNFIRRWGSSPRMTADLRPIVTSRESLALVGLIGPGEEQNVIPYLTRHEPYVDEVVLVTDGPQEAARAEVAAYVARELAGHPAMAGRIRIFERPLDRDFATQRNFAQEQCRTEWVLQADLDERFDRHLLESLPDILRGMRLDGKSVCGFPRLNYLDGILANGVPRSRWTKDDLAALTKDGLELADLDPQFRLLQRTVRWRRRVHEIPDPLWRDGARVTLWRQAAIRHRQSIARQAANDSRYETIVSGAAQRPEPVRQAYNDPQARSGMRILMIATEYPPAKGYGLARYAKELATSLVRAGAIVHVITGNSSAGLAQVEEDGVVVHLATGRDEPEHYRWVAGAVIGNLWLLERALVVCRDQPRFDVVLSHDWLGSLTAQAVKTSVGIPWILAMHDTEPGKRGNQLTDEQVYIAQMETWSCRLADALVVSSVALATEIGRFHGVPLGGMRRIPCGIRPERFMPTADLADFRELYADPSERVVLFVGRMSPMKGADLLVESAPRIAAEFPTVRFVMAGEGVLLEPLMQRAGELGLADRFIWTGHLAGSALAATYRVADVVVMPSRYEPFGMVALEALVCGVPLVARWTGGLKEILPKDHPAVALVDADEPDAYASAIVAMLRTEVTEEGRRRLIDHASAFTWADSARGFIDLARTLAGPARDP